MKKLLVKAYGYGTREPDDLIELTSVSVCGDATEFELLGTFFLKCAAEMKSRKDWDHEHFFDFTFHSDIAGAKQLDGVDLVASKLLEINRKWPPEGFRPD